MRWTALVRVSYVSVEYNKVNAQTKWLVYWPRESCIITSSSIFVLFYFFFLVSDSFVVAGCCVPFWTYKCYFYSFEWQMHDYCLYIGGCSSLSPGRLPTIRYCRIQINLVQNNFGDNFIYSIYMNFLWIIIGCSCAYLGSNGPEFIYIIYRYIDIHM